MVPSKACLLCFDSRQLVCGILCVSEGKQRRQNAETRYRYCKQLLVFCELITRGSDVPLEPSHLVISEPVQVSDRKLFNCGNYCFYTQFTKRIHVAV
jgi:hypothetical protein